MLKKYTFKSEKAGYNVLFLGAIHGNEPCGTKAIFKIVEKFASKALVPLKGSVSFIPVCNPEAFARNTRQIDENLNRIIQKYQSPQNYEQSLANELNEHIASADITIDLHSMFSPVDRPFIFDDYPTPMSNQIIQALNIEYIVEGWPQIYANSPIKDLSTGNCAHANNKICLTVECGHHSSEKAVETAYYTILSTLLSLKMLEGFPSTPVKQHHIVMSHIFIKEKDGRLVQDFKHLDKVSKDEILAVYNDGSQLICPNNGYIILPKPEASVNSEWFYLGHEKTSDRR